MRKKNIVFASVVLLAAAAVLLAVYFLAGGAATPRQFYLKAEGRNFRLYSDQIKKAYKDFYAGQKPYMDSPYGNRLEITADIRSDNDNIFGLQNAGGIFNLIRKCKLVYNGKNDIRTDRSLTDLSLLLEDSPVADASVVRKGRRFDIGIPVLLPDKHLSADRDRLKKLYDMFNIPVQPKRLFRPVDAARTLKLDENTFDRLINDYGAFLSGFISESEIKFGAGKKVKAGDREVQGREVLVTLDSLKTKKLFDDLVNKAANDDALLQLTYGNFAAVMKIADEAGIFQLIGFIGKSGYAKSMAGLKGISASLYADDRLEKAKNAIRKLGNSLTFPGGFKMTVVIDKKGNILTRDVVLPYRVGGGEPYGLSEFRLHTASNDIGGKNFGNTSCKIELTNSLRTSQLFEFDTKTSSAKAGSSDRKKSSIMLGWSSVKNGTTGSRMRLRLDLEGTDDTGLLKSGSAIRYNLSFANGGNSPEDKVYGGISVEKRRNDKLKKVNSDIGITVNIDIPSLKTGKASLKLDVAGEKKLLDQLDLPAVPSSGLVDIDTASESDIAGIKKEITGSFTDLYMENQLELNSR